MSKQLVVGAQGGTLAVDDVYAVACHNIEVHLDASNLDRLKKESPTPAKFQAESADEDVAAAKETLSRNNSRAALFCTLLRLAYGTSGVRSAVLKCLQRLLADDVPAVLPQAATDAAILAALPSLLHGNEAALHIDKQQLATALDGGDAPKVSTEERVQLTSGPSVSVGLLSIATVQLRKLVSASTAIAALSCEGLRASTAAFDPKVAAGTQLSVDAAAELVALLDSSALVNAKDGCGLDEAITQVPALHGEAQAALAHAYTALRAEVLTYAQPLSKHKTPTTPPSAALFTRAAHLSLALLPLANLSLKRTSLLASSLPNVKKIVEGNADAGLAVLANALTSRYRALQEQSDAARDAAQGALSNLISLTAAGRVSAVPGVDVALLVQRSAALVRACCALEGFAAVVALRQMQGRPPSENSAPEQDAAPAEGKKGKKQKGPRFALGKGTAVLRDHLEAAVSSSLGGSNAEGGSTGTVEIPADAFSGHRSELEQGFDLVAKFEEQLLGALDPDGSALGNVMDTIKRVVESNAARRKPKIPKGTKDFLPVEMAIRQMAFGKIEHVFQRHGAVTIDTPVFELRETLMGKYGEDSKLIYDLADQGGELLSLRYDLTVPFARYVAMNGIGRIKRYHLGKVYRRDNPQLARGRFREFCQCDFDIAGAYAHMVADAEVIKVLDEILTDLDIGGFVIKLNHRRLLDAMMAICGVPASRFRPICSAIDKLDKEPWSEVRREMVEDKGLAPEAADRIGTFVCHHGPAGEMLEKMLAMEDFEKNEDSKAALEDLRVMFDLLDAFGALERVSFDLSLARGLDYYTGVIYEAVLMSTKRDESGKEVSVGSVAAGGRYDGLIGMYSGKDIPAVGVSIGVERVFAILEGQLRQKAEESGRPVRSTRTQVLVGSFGKGLQKERMRVCSALWSAGIPAEFGYKPDPNFNKDIVGVAQDQGIPFVVVFGDEELEKGVVNVKDMIAETQDSVSRDELVKDLQRRLAERPYSVLS